MIGCAVYNKTVHIEQLYWEWETAEYREPYAELIDDLAWFGYDLTKTGYLIN